MHTVYIKSSEFGMLIDVDNLERMSFCENKIFAHNLYEERYPIYEGKAVNGDKALVKIAGLIHSAKRHSETYNEAVILDFVNDLDNPQIALTLTTSITHLKRFDI